MKTQLEDQTLALAGVFQAAGIVKQLAYTGVCDDGALQASLNSVLVIDTEATEDIFGGMTGLKDGLGWLSNQFTGKDNLRDRDVAAYVLQVLTLAKKLQNSSDKMAQIGAGIEQANQTITHYELMHENTYARFAGVYKETISEIKPRILVNGEMEYLKNERNANKIRAALLAGIRSGILWYQVGGSRLKLIFGQGKYVKTAQRLLSYI